MALALGCAVPSPQNKPENTIMKLFRSFLFAGAITFSCQPMPAMIWDPIGDGFAPVQGVLHENGQPVNGFMWFCWDLYATPAGGTSLAHDTNMTQVLVSNGVANVTYNLGEVGWLSPTQELYLQIDVSPTGELGSFTPLSPRHRIVPSLFATMAVRAEKARRLTERLSPDLLPASLPGLPFTGAPAFGATAGPPFTVTSSAMVAGLTAAAAGTAGYAADSDKLDGLDSSAFWQLLGNAGTTAGINFLGTTDNQPLELKVNSTRALRLEPTATSPNIIAGSAANAINLTAGSSILGGNLNLIDQASHAVIGGGDNNAIQASSAEATIGGGAKNSIGSGFEWATIAGGFSNRLDSVAGAIGGGEKHAILSGHGTIAGGNQNSIREFSDYSTISGGNRNLVNLNSVGATIGGGVSNTVDQAALYGTVAGGYSNTVGRGGTVIGGGLHNFVAANLGTVAGGQANQVQLDAKASSVGGGASNVVETAATNATIAGGFGNVVHTNANFSSIGGGRGNHIGSGTPFATIPGGREGRAISYGQVAHASGGFAGQEGTAQQSFYIVRGSTTDTNMAELFLDGASARIHVPSGSTWAFDVLVTARDAAAGSAGFQIRGMIGYNPAGNLVLLGAPITTPFFGVPAITAQVVPDNVNKAFAVKVTWGVANPNPVRWVATVRTAEVIH
jgi:hypothetical protein